MTSLSLIKERWASAVAFFIYTKENFAKSLTLKKETVFTRRAGEAWEVAIGWLGRAKV